VFHPDLTYVAMAIHVCCKCVFQMFQLFHLDVAYVAVATHVCCKSVCSKCFTCFRRMLQMFYLNVVICCRGYTHMLQTYVLIVSLGFTMLQQVLLPTRSDFAGMHALHIPIQRCLSLSCGSAPIVRHAHNGRSMPKWPSTLWSKCMRTCRALERANTQRT